MSKLNPSELPGSHRSRVFIGGSYASATRNVLAELSQVVRDRGFDPIIANEYALPLPERDIHDVTLFLLHACRLAIFEVSTLSGALMEIERLADYGVRRALLLYHHPGGRPWPRYDDAWKTTQMLKSLVRENQSRMFVRPYTRPRDAVAEAKAFLLAVRRTIYGKVHRI